MILLKSYNTDADVVTTNATPVSKYYATIHPWNTCAVKAIVVARGLADGTSAMWEMRGCVRRDAGDATMLILSGLDIVTPQKDLSAALWDAAIVASVGDIGLKVTGGLGVSIGWWFMLDVFGFSTANPVPA